MPLGMEPKLLAFDALTGVDVYDLLALRQRVFVVEQACAYLDADGLDRAARHVLMRDADGALIAYARVLDPGSRFATHAIGRVVVAPERRAQAIGHALIERTITAIEAAHGPVPITLAAQAHLQRFYARHGFVTVSSPYDEDGIPHVDMRRG
jgi:ElaA protein